MGSVEGRVVFHIWRALPWGKPGERKAHKLKDEVKWIQSSYFHINRKKKNKPLRKDDFPWRKSNLPKEHLQRCAGSCPTGSDRWPERWTAEGYLDYSHRKAGKSFHYQGNPTPSPPQQQVLLHMHALGHRKRQKQQGQVRVQKQHWRLSPFHIQGSSAGEQACSALTRSGKQCSP